jgi:hypothetical protein
MPEEGLLVSGMELVPTPAPPQQAHRLQVAAVEHHDPAPPHQYHCTATSPSPCTTTSPSPCTTTPPSSCTNPPPSACSTTPYHHQPASPNHDHPAAPHHHHHDNNYYYSKYLFPFLYSIVQKCHDRRSLKVKEI